MLGGTYYLFSNSVELFRKCLAINKTAFEEISAVWKILPNYMEKLVFDCDCRTNKLNLQKQF